MQHSSPTTLNKNQNRWNTTLRITGALGPWLCHVTPPSPKCMIHPNNGTATTRQGCKHVSICCEIDQLGQHLQVTPTVILLLLAAACAGCNAADHAEDDASDHSQEHELKDASQEGNGHNEGWHDGEATERRKPERREHRRGVHWRSHDDCSVVHSGAGGRCGLLDLPGGESGGATDTATGLGSQGLVGNNCTSDESSSDHGCKWQSNGLANNIVLSVLGPAHNGAYAARGAGSNSPHRQGGGAEGQHFAGS
mmetsp:Transcript_34188/g.75824  ORF Transcript_34188/g.75824 Transcript_34188/m.75824 type:complete len:252 (+) Transcript_34188:171-926(+)